MTLKDVMAADEKVFFNPDEFGETVSYNGTEITALLTIGEGLSRSEQIRVDGHSGTIEVKASDVPSPVLGDTIIDRKGRKWFVNEISGEDEIGFVLKVVSKESAIKTKGRWG